MRARQRKIRRSQALQGNDDDYAHVVYTSPQKRSRTIRALPKIYLADGRRFLQHSNLPIPPGQIGLYEASLGGPVLNTPTLLSPVNSQQPADHAVEIPVVYSLHHRKRIAQNNRWTTEIIPSLVQPYLHLMHDTENLRYEQQVLHTECTCLGQRRSLSVLVLRLYNLERIELEICQCSPAAVQLVMRGLFPCAPVLPTLAVDIRVLDLVSGIFLRMGPNNTAITETLQDFLDSRGYKMKGEDPLRRRFGNALLWFNALQDVSCKVIENKLDAVRQEFQGHFTQESNDSEDESNGSESAGNCTSNSLVDGEERDGVPPTENLTPLGRPSEYLRSRCPLCFGGKTPLAEGFGAIVCIDAVFTQKNDKHDVRDPPRFHPKTVFIPETNVNQWEDFVNKVRPRSHKAPKATTVAEDGYEGPLKVPNSVLDGCEQSFTAADENRQKASSKFFDSTALMGMLCRHDRVLWLVNMTSPGERQHYAFVLIDTLFQHLPLDFKIGLLYDVACSTHRSCIKWGFLNKYIPRLTFAISVFHAYGHGWPCQCIYHPRKCLGFGLSDGEGCERFWHMISKLVAYLRICGHHLRLYTLDRQVQHGDKASLKGFGKWLARRWRHALRKRAEGAQMVNESGLKPQELREQWDLQIAAQTKPLARQSKNAGKKAIEEALRLRRAVEELNLRISRLEDEVSDPHGDDFLVAVASNALPEARKKLRMQSNHLKQRERELGFDEKREYRHLANSEFIRHRMNARALKIRLRDRLRSRKFELDRVERSVRRQQFNERKIRAHTEDSVRRRDSGIHSLVTKYNALCRKMEALISKHRAPRNAYAPVPIPPAGIWALDVDDEIWQDLGLDEGVDLQHPPLWLSNDKVKQGIQGILLRDRADEELRRLRNERKGLYQWMGEEWDVVEQAIESLSGDDDLLYQMYQRREWLLQLCITWEQDLQTCPKDMSLPEWGPADAEIKRAKSEMGVEQIEKADEHDDEEYEDGESLDGIEDEAINDVGLMEHLDTLDWHTFDDQQIEGEHDGRDLDDMSSGDEWEDIV